MSFFKSAPKAAETGRTFDIAAIVAEALKAPKHPTVKLSDDERNNGYQMQAVARAVHVWGAYNREALNYRGLPAAEAQSALALISTEVQACTKEIARLRGELIRQTGGAEAAAAAFAAGVVVPFDPALVSGQYVQSNLLSGLRVKEAEVSRTVVHANAHAQAKADLTAIVAALFEVLA